ncbi:lycopene cyclase domain-containing protein [Brevibacterium sp. 5221]|uniref:Lycopene cyclase domain-containing protein n=1 Tax=Brevibacterium rongguiense TaxID=2695267 RepID=A0A6N9H730_9MICO|nr:MULTISPECIES: lycopene cyclase domain-containing protein [Brevibacterium]MYM19384.1 lycopene cyclase domain-containing protein [Brevibacterium rongguiense]WAL39320.1 lycopene cyclase domain-containing protein [Brevibacterium sp. BRM-1]
MTYGLINLAFLLPAAALVTAALRAGALRWRAAAAAAALLVALTIVFDNLMIAVGLMVYADAHASGLRIGLMPLEDLAYTVLAAAALPALWELLGRRERRRRC